MKVLRLSEREGGQTGRRLEPVKGGKMVWTPREEIVRGLLVKRARPTSLYALPGVGKGNVAIYIQLSIRHGLPVFGFEARSVDWFGYVDGEDDRAEFERRASRIAKGLAIELDDTLNYVEVPFKLNTAKSRREIEDVLCEWSKQGNGLVVYDSAQALFGGNQASGEMGDAVYSQVKSWGQRFNHTPIIIDHAPKGSESKGGAVSEYGSVYKRARVGSSLYLRQVEAVDSCTTLIDLYNPKSNTSVVDTTRSAEPLVRFMMHFDDGPEGAITVVTVHGEWQRLESLPCEEFSVQDAARTWELSEQQASKLLNKYCQRGLLARRQVQQAGRGRPPYVYRRTREGPKSSDP